MLSQSPEQSDNFLIICSAHGIYRIPASELSVDTVIPNIHSDSQQQGAEAQDTSCPYATANNSFIDRSAKLTLVDISHLPAKPLAVYRSQYKLPIHPATLPRGPPLFV